jgi:hypothetical protein
VSEYLVVLAGEVAENLAPVDGHSVEHIANVLPGVRGRDPAKRCHCSGNHGRVFAQVLRVLVDLIDAREGLVRCLQHLHQVLLLRPLHVRHLHQHLPLRPKHLRTVCV